MWNRNKYLENITKLERKLVSFPLKALNNSERENKYKIEKDLKSELEVLDYLCSLLEFLLISIQQKKAEHTRFEEAFIILGTKILSHARSIKHVLIQGWHGDAYSLINFLLSDIQMVMYLGYYPEHLELWFAEKQDSYKDDKFRAVFSENAIIKGLNQKNIETTYSIFSLFRKSAHGSYWGAQAYTTSFNIVVLPCPDIHVILVTLCITVGFLAAILHWFVNERVEFGFTFSGDHAKTFQDINNKLNASALIMIKRISNFIIDQKDKRLGNREGAQL